MTICIIGWYGTDTLGDRAILDGIIEIFREIDSELIIHLGSLFPFYSERAISEDNIKYLEQNELVRINIFPVKDKLIYKKNIETSDAIIMGGGPLMDLEELFIVRNGFDYAKKKGIPRIILGCGIGPLTNPLYVNVVDEILGLADEILLRDSDSMNDERFASKYKLQVIGDPAIISVNNYKEKTRKKEKNYCAINFRDWRLPEYEKNKGSIEMFSDLVKYISAKYENVYLVPMHTFSIGGDDRRIMTEVVQNFNFSNVEIIHEPMNIYKMYAMFMNAKATIGMRYHSVLVQTILNGNNFILNYTGKKHGKIRGFIKDIGGEAFYENRIWNMDEPFENAKLDVLLEHSRFNFCYTDMKSNYVRIIKGLLEK